MKADEGIVARRYARALMLFGDEHGNHEGLLEQLGTLADTLVQVPVMESVFHSPLLSKKQKSELLDGLKGTLKMGDAMVSFVNVLIQKGRTEYIGAIRLTFERLLDEKKGRVRGTVETASAVNPIQQREILLALSKRFGKEVIPEFEVNEDLLAGVRARVGNTLLDSSLRGKLDELREQLKSLSE